MLADLEDVSADGRGGGATVRTLPTGAPLPLASLRPRGHAPGPLPGCRVGRYASTLDRGRFRMNLQGKKMGGLDL